MNRFMIGCGEKDLYFNGSVLSNGITVGDKQTVNLCEWDDSLIGKTLRVSVNDKLNRSHVYDCSLGGGDTGVINSGYIQLSGKPIQVIAFRIYRNGNFLLIYCENYTKVRYKGDSDYYYNYISTPVNYVIIL
nr:MAG TPA: hypothetical protein [Bacteriophage sp.]